MPLSRWLPRLVLSALLVCIAAGAAMGAEPPRQQRQTVAVGDIHGAYDELVALLGRLGLVDELGGWSGGATTLVQTGDMLDRGADARRVMDLMIRLQAEAQRAGGRVVVLLGNHEIMNLVGARQDVTVEILASFRDRDSESRQRQALREFEDSVKRTRGYRSSDPRARRELQREWLEAHPPGLVEMVRALGPDGSYGRWLRSLPMYWRSEGVLYMHAGISEGHADTPLEELDARVRAEIATFDRYRAWLQREADLPETASLPELLAAATREFGELDELDVTTVGGLPELPGEQDDLDRAAAWGALGSLDAWHLFSPDGPMWFRGYARWGYEEVRRRAPGILEQLGVSTIVVGHTPQQGGIRVRADGAVYLIDTGMLTSVYGGPGEALVLEGGVAAAVRADGTRRLLPAPAAVPVAGSR